MPNLKETLIVLTPGFPANEEDTTCLPFLQTHIRAINKEYPALEIIVLAFQYPNYKGTYKWYGNEVIGLDGRNRPKANRALTWLRAWNQLKMIKRQRKVVGLLSIWCTECAMVGRQFARYHYLKHYTCICGQDAKAGNKYVPLMKPNPKYLIATSDFLKKTFRKNYGIIPAHVIPWGVDADQFTSGGYVRDIDVLGVGSLIPLKQYDVFVKVIDKLASDVPGINAAICGKGPEKDALKNSIEELDLAGNIKLAGEIPHKDVLQLMQRAKVLLHTSSYEGFGTVCIEALYAGTSVVSFTKPMNMTIPNWYHVNNEEEMVNKVKELLQVTSSDHAAIYPYEARTSAIKMMKLYA